MLKAKGLLLFFEPKVFMPSLTNCSQRSKYSNYKSTILGYKLRTSYIYFYCTNSKDGKSGELADVQSIGGEQNDSLEKSPTSITPNNAPLESPEEPTTCCMSGCANCVWLEYAEKLTEYYKDGGEKSIKEINEKITDPNIKAYLLHEIRMRNKK